MKKYLGYQFLIQGAQKAVGGEKITQLNFSATEWGGGGANR